MKHVLIIKTSSMGDVIHTLPAVTDAALHLPELRFHWLVEEAFADIPAMHFQVERVIPVAWRRWRKNLWAAYQSGELQKFWQELRAENYDYVIDAQGLLKSALLARIARGIHCGPDYQSSRESLASLFYQRRYPVSAIEKQHAVIRSRELFASILNYPLPTTRGDYGLTISNLHQKSKNISSVMFIHSTARDYKLWPEDYWIDLANRLKERELRIHLPWGNATEKLRAERIAKACKNAEVLPKSNLRELALLLMQEKAVVTVDTGLGHLAAALNIPGVSLYGPTDPSLIGTYGESQIHLCADAFGADGKSPMANLKPDKVWGALEQLLSPFPTDISLPPSGGRLGWGELK